jgi:hypothetical protein
VLPRAAARAEEALHTALAGIRGSRWPEVAWRASSLTNTGFPVEWSWSSRDPSLRWTAEASGPETPERERLPRALEVLRAVGGKAEVPAWLWPRAGQELRFGAWIGGRHDEQRDRYKLYIDASGAKVPAPDAVPRRTCWRMAGLESGTGIVELYGRLDTLEVWEVERMLAACALDARPLIAMAGRLAGPARNDRLLPGTAGITVAMHEDAVVAAGVFIHASPLLGSDALIARSVRELAACYRWETSIYEALLGSETPEEAGRHGMIGFGAASHGKPWLQIGLRP